MEDPYIGKLLDNRYELLERIGVGGMAVVYKARCHLLNRLVAVKILRSELAQDAEFRRRFHDESQAIAMLSHPNLVAVYDVSKSSELEYIVMELIDGITLKQYMQRKGEPLNWREALHFTTQIVKALGHAHSRGIIHRDIKPQNVMVLRDGTVRVADFGIARFTTGQQATLTQEALGSVHYISPEQARGSHIDCRSDLYSVGVVLYEMLTGRLPFEGDSPVAVAIQHIHAVPLSPRDLNPDIPEALEAITMKAMAPNVEQRYADAEAMLRDLEEFRKDPDIHYDYPSFLPAGGEGGDEPTQVLPLSGGKTRRSQPREEEAWEGEEELPDSRAGGRAPLLLGAAALLLFLVGVGYFLWVSFFSGLLEPTQQYTVPNLLGKTMAELQLDTTLTEPFQVEQGGLVYHEKPAGQIIEQSPQPGEKREGDELVIVVVVSAGQEKQSMADLKDKDYREAFLAVEKLGLVLDEPEYRYSDVPKGYVISFTPAAGTEVLPGETVHLVISNGPEEKLVEMEDFLNYQLDEVTKRLEELGLVLGAIDPVADMSLPGTVLEQSVAPHTQVAEGTIIHFTVSQGPDGTGEDPGAGTGEGTTGGGEAPVVNPTQAPLPTPNYKTVSVDLGGGEGNAHITILVDGKSVYDNVVGRNLGTVNLTVPGTGEQLVQIYLDDVLVESRTIDFST